MYLGDISFGGYVSRLKLCHQLIAHPLDKGAKNCENRVHPERMTLFSEKALKHTGKEK